MKLYNKLYIFRKRYLRVLRKIFLQRSPESIQDSSDEALKMHSLFAASSSLLQVCKKYDATG